MNQTALLVFARAAGMMARAPGFSHPAIPPPVRAGIALALAFAVAPGVGAVPVLSPPAFALAIAADVAIGAAIGAGASLIYDGAYAAGRLIDDTVGIRGSVPGANVASTEGFGRLWSSAFLAAFVLLGGWVPVVHAFADSFARLGVAAFPAPGDWWHFALRVPVAVLAGAVPVAAPAIAVAAAAQLALGAIARVVPRFASFTLTFPVVFAGVLLVTLVAIPALTAAGGHPLLVLPWSAR